MSLRETVESLSYLTERYVAPHIERTAVNNRRMSAAETRALLAKLETQGLVRTPVRAVEVLRPDQQAFIRQRRAKAAGIAVISTELDCSYETVRRFVRLHRL